MKVEYKTSVYTPAGHRSVYVVAEAEKISAKRCVVNKVLTIDDEVPSYNMSRTGANRQKYNGLFYAENEVGKKKNLSTLKVLH